MTAMYQQSIDSLLQLFHGHVPEYILAAGPSSLTVRLHTFRGEEIATITPQDLEEYYRSQAGSPSGIRILAGVPGDWRPIDELARLCARWFRFVALGSGVGLGDPRASTCGRPGQGAFHQDVQNPRRAHMCSKE